MINPTLLTALETLHPQMVSQRRHLHMHPELSFHEETTPAYIADFLESLGLSVRRGVGGRGVVADIAGAKPGKTVALRADFDALPIHEENDVTYRSQTAGVMHACGHDGHTASLMAVAQVLADNREAFAGTVRFIFQFAEEVAPGGAVPMIADGCLEGVDAIFGNHFLPSLPVGTYGYKPGISMGNADDFKIHIKGKGGHGAAPHQTIDPIMVAAQAVVNLQTIVSRRVNPLSPVVISVGKLEAGGAFNVIADTATIVGTVRTLDLAVQEFVIQEMHNVLAGTCQMAGASYELAYNKGYPVVDNSVAETGLVYDTVTHLVSPDHVQLLEPFMGGEDFAYYLQRVPGSFFNTGCGNVAKGLTYPLHHPKFDLDEDALLYAAKGLLSVALAYLAG